MSFIYVWQPAPTIAHHARSIFENAIYTQRDMFEAAFGRPFETHLHQTHGVWIGHIHFETGVRGWTPWLYQHDQGLAWSGVCEEYLGAAFDDITLRKTVHTLEHEPDRVMGWTGKFGVCSWSGAGGVRLTTGATQAPPFWYSEGPNGWAIGSHARPALELVDQSIAINMEMAGLYVAFGYLVGNGALLDNVTRLPAGRQVSFRPHTRPTITHYAPLSSYLQSEHNSRDLRVQARVCAERLVTRVQRQVQFSSHPRTLLTGGRDSRCIAGALAQAGFAGVAQTTGTRQSTDAKVAAKIADVLGFRHELNDFGGHTHPMAAVSVEGAQRWMRVSEGLENMRHAVFFPGFFKREFPFPAVPQQLFHGVGGEITRGVNYPLGYDLSAPAQIKHIKDIMVTKKIPQGLVVHQPVEEHFGHVIQGLHAEVQDVDVSLAQWLDFFYWQNRDLHWGADFLSIRDVVYWHWTPLIDRAFVQAAWQLAPQDKLSNKFIHEVTEVLAPELRRIEYDHADYYVVAKRVARKVLNGMSQYNKRFSLGLRRNTFGVERDPALLQFWDDVLFKPQSHTWTELVDEAQLRYLINTNPASDILWNVATIELVAQAHGSM